MIYLRQDTVTSSRSPKLLGNEDVALMASQCFTQHIGWDLSCIGKERGVPKVGSNENEDSNETIISFS